LLQQYVAGNTWAAQLAGSKSHQVVLFGLSVLLPFMSEQLLKYPKLPRLYFNLLAYIMESYAEQVAALDPRHLVALLSSLEFGVSHTTDTLVLHSALEGLAELLLRRLLLSGDCSQDVVELAADALQPLLLVEPTAYADLAGQIIQASTACLVTYPYPYP
ncbi:importin N-terminal domain-containing protein, partial [Haematococcus lacustris]